MEENNQMLKDILEVVNFLKDNSVTKAEFSRHEEKQSAEFDRVFTEFGKVYFEFDKVYSEFGKVRGEIVDHVDGFVGLHQHLEVELAAMAHKTNRLENYIHTIAKHLQLQLDKVN